MVNGVEKRHAFSVRRIAIRPKKIVIKKNRNQKKQKHDVFKKNIHRHNCTMLG